MTQRLNHKVALITGGARGFGKAIASLFLSEGATVIITDIDEAGVLATAKELGCKGLVQDVSNEARWAEVVAEAEGSFGKLHILVNNAGIMGDMSLGSPEETTVEDFNRVIAVNLGGAFLGCKTTIPAIRRAGGGAIVNMSSIASEKGTWFETAYGMSKAGVKQLTLSVAQHCAKENIRCNSVHPGQMATAMSDMAYDALYPKFGAPSAEALRDMMLGFTPMGSLGTSEDVAYAALYLASDESRYVTGTSIFVDGGMSVN